MDHCWRKETFYQNCLGYRERGRKLQTHTFCELSPTPVTFSVMQLPVSHLCSCKQSQQTHWFPMLYMDAIISLLHHLSPIRGEQVLVWILLAKVTWQSYPQKPMECYSLELHAFAKKTAKENTGEKVIVLRQFQQVSPAPITSGSRKVSFLTWPLISHVCIQPVKAGILLHWMGTLAGFRYL